MYNGFNKNLISSDQNQKIERKKKLICSGIEGTGNSSTVHIPFSTANKLHSKSNTFTNIIVQYDVGSTFTLDETSSIMAATQFWQQLIDLEDVPIIIKFYKYVAPNDLTLAYASVPDVFLLTGGSGYSDFYYQPALYNKTSAILWDDASSIPSIEIYINDSYSNDFYYGPGNENDTVPSNKYDFISIVMHEITHGLGFSGSDNIPNGSSFVEYGIQDGAATNYEPMIFDKFVQRGATDVPTGAVDFNLTDFVMGATGDSYLTTFLTGNDIYFRSMLPGQSPLSFDRLYNPSSYSSSSTSHMHMDNNSIPTLMMHPKMDMGAMYRTISLAEKNILATLGWYELLPVGIEDELNIVGSFDGQTYAQPVFEFEDGESAEYNTYFEDEPPYSTLVSWDFKVELLSNQGLQEIDNNSNGLPYTFIYDMNAIPIGIDYSRNEIGQIRGILTCTATDSDNVIHIEKIPLFFAYKPNTPLISLDNNIIKNDCDNTRVSFFSNGASSYNLYYKSSSDLSFNQINIPLGQNSITVSNLNETLDYEFKVEAINNFGTTQGEIVLRKKCNYVVSTYPNPTVDLLTILSSSDDPFIQEINLKKIDNLSIGMNKIYDGTNSATLNVSNLPNGTYLVEIFNADGQMTTRTIIKY